VPAPHQRPQGGHPQPNDSLGASPGRFRRLKGWVKGESLNGELAVGSSLTRLPSTDSES
jgi:hypothetical protein